MYGIYFVFQQFIFSLELKAENINIIKNSAFMECDGQQAHLANGMTISEFILYVFTKPLPHEQDEIQVLTGCLTKAKAPGQSYYLPVARRRTNVLMSFPKTL